MQSCWPDGVNAAAPQVQLGFHLPSSLLLAREMRERAAFLPEFLLQTALRFQGGDFRLGRRQSARGSGPVFSPEVEARLAALGQAPTGKP